VAASVRPVPVRAEYALGPLDLKRIWWPRLPGTGSFKWINLSPEILIGRPEGEGERCSPARVRFPVITNDMQIGSVHWQGPSGSPRQRSAWRCAARLGELGGMVSGVDCLLHRRESTAREASSAGVLQLWTNTSFCCGIKALRESERCARGRGEG
jgi:hypothetical protein